MASMKPDSITGGGDPRSMVRVRLAGAEVSEAFLTKLARLSCPNPCPLTSQPRLLTTGNSPARVLADGSPLLRN
jgi:hypothetical protein